LLSKGKKTKDIYTFIKSFLVNDFKFGGGGGGVEKKEEEELREQIDMKVSTKFQINPSTNGLEKCT
jgi:hypothetical protein